MEAEQRGSNRRQPLARDARWLSVLSVAGPAALALVLATWLSTMLPLWRDEFATRQYAALSLGDLMAATSHVDAVIAPYYAFIHLLSGVTGLGTGMRLWSLLAFGGAVAALGTLALRWWGRAAAATTGTMLAVNGAVLSQAANARPYALALCAVASAALLLDQALRGRHGGRTRRGRVLGIWAGYSVAAVAAVLMQPFAATAITATMLLARTRRALLAWVLASVPWAATALLLLGNGRSQGGQIEWVAPIDVDTVSWAVAKAAGMTGKGFAAPTTMIAVIVLMALLAIAVTLPRRPAVFAAALVATPIALLVVLSVIMQPVVSWRYLLWISLGIALLSGAAVGAVTRPLGGAGEDRPAVPVLVAARFLAGALAISLLGATGWHTVAGLTTPPSPRDDFPAAVSQIEAGARVGDLLIVQQRYGQGGVALGFAVSAGDDAFVGEIEANAPQGPREPLALRVITSVAPLRTAPWSLEGADLAADADTRSLWLVAVSSPRGEDPSSLPAPVAACFREAGESTRVNIPATRLYRIPCGR